ncbi:hypothetical protein [Streptomyces sp. WM6368]|uniref:hypothetical protein n=1 Tax=Streptomyces sp. WM6368 TaxID=1415554 RepID=UPI0006AF16B3|nr:hypothetical protein [Streptomyces sp. WM6368]KOU20116.1 hypothetical protein ADK51_25575 [Streptomyces sp. WM6368]
MTAPDGKRRASRPVSELRDVYDFLEEVRLRYVCTPSTDHAPAILLGFDLAVQIHGTAGATLFDDDSAFRKWLYHQINGQYGSLIWGYAIELEAKDRGLPAMDIFFEILDKVRAETTR